MPDELLKLAVDSLPIGMGALVFLLARRLISPFNQGRSLDFQVAMLRVVAVLFIGLEVLDVVAARAISGYQAPLSRIGHSLMAVMAALFAFSVAGHLARRRFGIERELDGERTFLDNYNSRLVAILSAIVLFLITIYTVIRIWELDSLLEATGLLGVIFAFLALTNAIWAPDIYYGLVILNTDMLEGGDTIRMGDSDDLYLLHKVSFTHTLLLNVSGNNRTLIRNSKLMDQRIDNLTKRASIEGIRQSLRYKISYPAYDGDSEQRAQSAGRYLRRIEELKDQVVEEAGRRKLPIKDNMEMRLINTGDHALDYDLNYYLEPLPLTRVTRRIRESTSAVRSALNEIVLSKAYALGLDLRTPLVVASVPTVSSNTQSNNEGEHHGN